MEHILLYVLFDVDLRLMLQFPSKQSKWDSGIWQPNKCEIAVGWCTVPYDMHIAAGGFLYAVCTNV